MRLKSYQIDGRLLLPVTANFSASGLKCQHNDRRADAAKGKTLPLLREPETAAGYGRDENGFEQ
jgi:hypothetical protein